MIEYIHGEIVELTPTQAILETGGIGYSVQITLTNYTLLQNQKKARLYIYEAIREDAHTLYGFLAKEERMVFLLLISVSGIGANIARMIMSSYNVEEIQHIISTGNERAISAVKGIGTRIAQRIIVDLKDKIMKLPVSGGENNMFPGFSSGNETREEALAALSMLGFASAAAQKAVDSILKKEPGLKVEQLIKQALKMI